MRFVERDASVTEACLDGFGSGLSHEPGLDGRASRPKPCPLCASALFVRRSLIITSLTLSARGWLRAAALLTTLSGGAAAATEPRIALVIASGQVAARDIAPVPACPPSARAIGRQLTGLGFTVVESVDRTRGETAAAIADFARRLREAPGARGIVYACGPIADLEGRAFFLPSSATLDRPTDVLTQGVLLRSLPDMLMQARVGAALFALDVFAETPRLPALPAPPADATLGLILSSQAGRDGQRTALASALLGELIEPVASGVDLGTLLTRLQVRLEGEASRPQLRVERPGTALALLPAPADPAPPAAEAAAAPSPPAVPPAEAAVPPAAAPAPDAPPPVAALPPAADPAPPAPPPVAAAPSVADPAPAAPGPRSEPAPTIAAAPSTPAASAPVAPPAAPPVVDLVPLSETDRRAIQTSLSALGYYRDRIDGNFRPSTRAAIRRYQREIGEAPTSALTAEQARRLIAGAAARHR